MNKCRQDSWCEALGGPITAKLIWNHFRVLILLYEGSIKWFWQLLMFTYTLSPASLSVWVLISKLIIFVKLSLARGCFNIQYFSKAKLAVAKKNWRRSYMRKDDQVVQVIDFDTLFHSTNAVSWGLLSCEYTFFYKKSKFCHSGHKCTTLSQAQKAFLVHT